MKFRDFPRMTEVDVNSKFSISDMRSTFSFPATSSSEILFTRGDGFNPAFNRRSNSLIWSNSCCVCVCVCVCVCLLSLLFSFVLMYESIYYSSKVFVVGGELMLALKATLLTHLLTHRRQMLAKPRKH